MGQTVLTVNDIPALKPETYRALGSSGIKISPFGLGTVKFGRNTGLKYPAQFALPTDNQLEKLLLVAKELGLAKLRLETLDAQPRSTELDEIRIYLEKRFVLIGRVSSLQLKKARLEGGFWLLDEEEWRKEEIENEK